MDFPTMQSRITKAAEVLKIKPEDFEKNFVNSSLEVFDNEEGLKLLDAQSTSEQYIFELLYKHAHHGLPAKAAAAILKGKDPFASEQTVPTPPTIVADTNIPHPMFPMPSSESALVEAFKSMRDPKQLKDRELLDLYNDNRDEYEIEQELHRRARFQPFVVFKNNCSKYSGGKKEIDVEMSLELLKKARKDVNPTIVKYGNVFVNVYRVTELNPEDQIVEICSFCGEILYRGYCAACESDFTGMGDDEKAFIRLVADSSSMTRSDRKDLLLSAGKGIEELHKSYPKTARKFDELKLTNDLPKLRKVKNLPSQRPADPFHVSGNVGLGHTSPSARLDIK